MNLRRILIPGSIALVVACTSPTEGCACSPAEPVAVVFGTITRDGTPSPEHLIVMALDEGCDVESGTVIGSASGSASLAAGEYRLSVRLHGPPGTKCVVVEVPTLEGSVYSAGTMVDFRMGAPFDSAEVNVDIPGPGARPPLRLSP